MRAALFVGTAALLALSCPAYAAQQPVPSRLDNRIGEVVYRPNDVTKIWSTPAGVILIQFGEGEIFDAATGADACPPHYKPEDNCGFSAEPRGNFLFLKLRKCLIPEPVLVLTKTASGKFRSYNFELHTEPQICSDTPIAQPDSGMKLVSSANAAPKPVGTGNLKYISEDALTEHADKPVQYSVRFQYPGDEAEKRRETSRERRERAKKEAVTQALNREVDFKTHDPFYGNRNYRYAIRGSNNLQPRGIFDNGYLTAITYPGMQRMPAVFRVDPDGKESTANFTVRGDTIIMTGTAQVIRVRDGLTVAEFYNLGYSLSGATPGTGTASPSVERIVKGASE